MSDQTGINEREEFFERLRTSLDDAPASEPLADAAADPVEGAQSDAASNAPESALEATVLDVRYDDRPATITIPLEFPFVLEDVRYDRIELRPPSVLAVRNVKVGAATVDDLFAEMAGVPRDVLLALRWPDAERVTINARLIAPELIG